MPDLAHTKSLTMPPFNVFLRLTLSAPNILRTRLKTAVTGTENDAARVAQAVFYWAKLR